MTRLRVWSTNVYRNNPTLLQLVEQLEKGRADAIGAQEAFRVSSLMGYRRFRPDIAAGIQGTEVANFLPRPVDFRGEGAYRATRDLGDPRDHERWIVWTRWVQDGHRLVLINTHFNAGLQEVPSGALVDDPRVDEARRHMRTLLREIRRQLRDGWLPIVTGDFNYCRRREQSGRLWRWSPHRALRRAGLTYFSHGLDGIAVPRHVAVRRAGAFALLGSDHKGFELLVDLGEASK